MNTPDPFDSVSWQHDVRRLADEYLQADDALKQANEELKPYRQAKKLAKQKLEDLMAKHRLPAVHFEERNESVVLAQRTAKKKPSNEKLKERCFAICKNQQVEADKMFEFLTKPVEEPTVSLRRKRMSAAAARAKIDHDEE